jgi:vacuolar protein sorting-associated protein 16
MPSRQRFLLRHIAPKTNQEMLDDSIRLLKLQESYNKDLEPRKSYVGLSLNETLYQLVVDQETSKGSKLQSAFRISDETFWVIKLGALVASRRFDELRTWSQTKKSPIGYEVPHPAAPLLLY